MKGFTLIEVIVYLALFALILGGAVISAYNVFESSGRGGSRGMLQEEGDFVMAKISWALSGASAIASPAIVTLPCSATSDTLSVSKWDSAVDPVAITLTGTNATISKKGAAAVPINSSSVQISNLRFKHCWLGGANPDSLEASFTVNMRTPQGAFVSQDFSNTEYVRR